MKKAWIAAAAAVLAFPAMATAACATKSEVQAINLRALKSSLMVAALSCGQQSEYNAFINKHNALFSSDGHEVKGYFSRNYGSSGDYHMNRFITKLANEASNVSMKQSSEAYCTAMKSAFKEIVAMNRESVQSHAASARYVSLHGIDACATGADNAKMAMNSNSARAAK